jgi:hypothetical protein
MRCSAIVVAVFCSCAVAAERTPGPWDLIELRRQPNVEWIRQEGNIRLLTYNGEPLNGRPTRVFAYYGIPKTWTKDSERVPAMVLVHGGGGRAFREWVAKWTLHGYAAIAMDLSGRDSAGQRQHDGMPDQGHEDKFHTLDRGLKATWPYHAVAAVIRAVSFLEHQPEVHTGCIGITGISWGGYLTCIAAGLDDRLKVAIPVYGCGFLHVDSAWHPILHERMSEAHRKLWVENFDPSQYLGLAHMPMLWVNGTNDFAYPLSVWQRSYRLPQGPRALRVTVRMPHGHRAGWEPVEIGIFADQHLLEATPLPQIGAMQVRGKSVSAPFESQTAILRGALLYTTDTGPWQKRRWQSRPAAIDSGRITAALPDARPIVFFLNITDLRRATVSAEHQALQ